MHDGTNCLNKPWLRDIVEEGSEAAELMHLKDPNCVRLIVEDLKELKRLQEEGNMPSKKTKWTEARVWTPGFRGEDCLARNFGTGVLVRTMTDEGCWAAPFFMPNAVIKVMTGDMDHNTIVARDNRERW